MLDDLRKSTQSNDETFEIDDDDLALLLEQEREVRDDKMFLGMRPVERMMLSVFLFMNVCVLVLALLLATKRLVF